MRAGTSAPTLHRYESGWERFEVGTLRRLADALGARLVVRLVPVPRPAPPEGESARSLADHLRPLFWDVDLSAEHLVEYPEWVLRRVLQYGDWEAVHRGRRYFGDDAVRRAVGHRSMDARTRRFWQVVLEGTER